jgi:diguanylate cyclase (GGDEF)-like protein
MNFADRFYGASKQSRIFVAFALLALITLIDWLTGSYLGLSIFYLIPILLVTLSAGRWAGAAFSLISATAWLIADLEKGGPNLTLTIHSWNAGIRFGFFIIVVFLLSALRREREQSRQDALTGIANRQAFVESAEREIRRAKRYAYPLTLAFVDCDDFKAVNDSLGHLAGDRLLGLIAQSLRRGLRSTDTVARFGGDEFAILLPHLGADLAGTALTRIRNLVAEAGRVAPAAVTFSVGAITFARAPESVHEMLRKADSLMYEAKGTGGDRIVHEIVPESAGSSWPSRGTDGAMGE